MYTFIHNWGHIGKFNRDGSEICFGNDVSVVSCSEVSFNLDSAKYYDINVSKEKYAARRRDRFVS